MPRRKDSNKIEADYTRLPEQSYKLWGMYESTITRAKVIEGQRYGKLVVVVRVANQRRSRYACVCDCGIITDVEGYALTSGRQVSCGCVQRELGKRLPDKIDIVALRDSFISEGYVIDDGWEYKNTSVPIPYVCPNNHNHGTNWGFWKRGVRCKWCSRANCNIKRFSYLKNRVFILYWIRIYDWLHGRSVYKFGITTNSVAMRFNKHAKEWGFKFNEIHHIEGKASEICMLEQSLLYRVQEYRAKWVPNNFGGHTECFECSEEEALRIWNDVVNG